MLCLAARHRSSRFSNSCSLDLAFCSVGNFPCMAMLRDKIYTLRGNTASNPYTKEKGVVQVDPLMVVRYA